MSEDEFFFFNAHPAALPLYAALKDRMENELGGFSVKVSKTQISFSNRYNFAFVSFLPVRRAKDRPKDYITVTFGLGRREDSPRIDAASEPYPNRWTHHVLVASREEIDGELMEWLRRAYDFAAAKGRG